MHGFRIESLLEIINTIKKFILNTDPETITSATLIFQAIQSYCILEYNKLASEIKKGIDSARIKIDPNSERDLRVLESYYNVSIFMLWLRLSIISKVSLQ